ncbi:MAG TPA: ATP-binding cassette domain-containing protein [Lachnospiraceae bacterium]|nr:ATP-binding cassette domain-containing protein [Lachnospiraceae bacterium]
MDKGTIIRIEGLSKRFGDNLLFEGTNIDIAQGETVALTGCNGTGKSTLLKMIAGFMKPSAGKISFNKDLRFNYIPDRFPKLSLSMDELIKHLGGIEGLDSGEIKKQTKRYYEMFQVTEMIHTPIKFLSKGTMQKVAVIQALISKPDVLLLDEPLSGQDKWSQMAFINEMKRIKKENVSIIMSCHEPFLVDQLADVEYHIKGRVWSRKAVSCDKQGQNAVLIFRGNRTDWKKYIGEDSVVTYKEVDSNSYFIIREQDTTDFLQRMIASGETLLDYHLFGREEDYTYVKSIDTTR